MKKHPGICGLRWELHPWHQTGVNVVSTVAELSDFRRKSDGRVVLVPTMGALHAGHRALIRQARNVAGADGTVMVSIFVNPIQFDRTSDLDAYPRPLERDLEKCESEGVDVVFTPGAGAMYHEDRSVTVTESLLSKSLCGATRPGHFDGVCTVVLKLFMLSGCDAAIFGEKDFQQLAIIRRMVRDLNVPVEIIEGATVREPDGLAMSSRNVRLTKEQREDAPRIYQALQDAAGHNDVESVVKSARSAIEASDLARIDYVSVVDAETLQPVTSLDRPVVLAAAVFYGDVRLIDHVVI